MHNVAKAVAKSHYNFSSHTISQEILYCMDCKSCWYDWLGSLDPKVAEAEIIIDKNALASRSI
jgi:hypothetical protein